MEGCGEVCGAREWQGRYVEVEFAQKYHEEMTERLANVFVTLSRMHGRRYVAFKYGCIGMLWIEYVQLLRYLNICIFKGLSPTRTKILAF